MKSLFSFMSNLFKKQPTQQLVKTRKFCPSLEILEDRLVPTVTFQGGALLPHVEAQPLFLGSNWYTNPLYQQSRDLNNYVQTLVNSSFMDDLTIAGYGVGRGSATPGKYDLVKPGSTVGDYAIRYYVQNYVSNGALNTPDANRLYMVFVQPNVVVRMSDGSASNATDGTGFLGYHGAFFGRDSFGRATDIHYAVMAYPGGSVNNYQVNYLGAVDSITDTFSHEVAEAATDANVNYKAMGWYDGPNNGEIGDLSDMNAVMLNGHAVQPVVDKNNQAMLPAGAAPLRQVTFELTNTNQLWEYNAADGWGTGAIDTSSVSLSDQGIDTDGHAMVDVIDTNGEAWEYHDVTGWRDLAAGASAAVAGNGVSYVLIDGNLWQFKDSAAAGQEWTNIDNNVASISAGTDRFGVNAVDMVFTDGQAWQYSDTSGWTELGVNVQTVSAGLNGYATLLFTNGAAYSFQGATGRLTYLDSNVANVTAGANLYGAPVFEMLHANGAVTQRIGATGALYSLDNNVADISKVHNGVLDLLYTDGKVWQLTPSGWSNGPFDGDGNIVRAV